MPMPEATSATELSDAILEALPIPCLIVDAAHTISDANRRASDLFREPLRGRTLAEVLPFPDLLEAVAAAVNGARRTVRFLLPSPVGQWFEASAAGLRFRAEPPLVLITLTDLTQQQRIDRIRADFVANASHELRTPLASLLGFIETLQGPARDDAEARERFLAVMRTQAERMSRLVSDLLSLSRIEVSEHLRPDTRVDLRGVISHVADSLASLAQENGVALVVVLPPEPLVVFGERDELVRVFENLIENAIKYGASGRRGRGNGAEGAAERRGRGRSS